MIALFLRVVFGFILACLAVAVTKVAFVITPADLLALEPDSRWERLARAGVLTLAVATQTALFTAPFAVIVIAYAYWRRISAWPFYVFSGLLISVFGLAVLFAAESPSRPTIANAYAVAAYIFAGMIGGYVYWAVAGRRASGSVPPRNDFAPSNGSTGTRAGPGPNTENTRARAEDVRVERRGNGTQLPHGTS